MGQVAQRGYREGPPTPAWGEVETHLRCRVSHTGWGMPKSELTPAPWGLAAEKWWGCGYGGEGGQRVLSGARLGIGACWEFRVQEKGRELGLGEPRAQGQGAGL